MPEFYKNCMKITTGLFAIIGGYIGTLYYYDSSKNTYQDVNCSVNRGVNLSGLLMYALFGAGYGVVLSYSTGISVIWPITAPFICIVGPVSFINVRMTNKEN